MSADKKAYLGDSVYADLDNGMIRLTTENGLASDPSNTIYLEPEVMDALIKYAKRMWGPSPIDDVSGQP